jgi:putative tryptophan/tyrosine transport system substrate-binding protein
VKRRTFIAGLGSAAAWSVVARAQQRALPVIGFLRPESADASEYVTVPFLQGLKETGYVEGQNMAVEYRGAENQFDRLPALAADLVRRRVAVIVATFTGAALAAKAATTTIPIVFNTGGDPVALGLVATLNRPGGNVTGYTSLQSELAPKRLQLLRELIPNAALFGVLADPSRPDIQSQIADLQAAAHTLGLLLVVVNADTVRLVISKRPSQLFRNSALVRSWSASVPSSEFAWNNSWRWRCPRFTQFVITPSPAV